MNEFAHGTCEGDDEKKRLKKKKKEVKKKRGKEHCRAWE